MNKVAFIDMEGVLVPEIWKLLANELNIAELNITTREVEDYEKLMLYRIDVLNKNRVTLFKIQNIINQLDPIDGAVDFLQSIRKRGFDVQIVSDCFHELLEGFLKKLVIPIETVYCHRLQVDNNGYIMKALYSRQEGKHEVIKRYPMSLDSSIAVGDAFNDFTMLKAVPQGYLFAPSKDVLAQSSASFKVVYSYLEIINMIDRTNLV